MIPKKDSLISDELREKLHKKYGLTNTQLDSAIAHKVVAALSSEEDETLINNAKNIVQSMAQECEHLKCEVYSQISTISETLKAVSNAQKTYGPVLDKRTADAIAAYCALIEINKAIHCSPEISVKEASYIVYALLVGNRPALPPLLENAADNAKPKVFPQNISDIPDFKEEEIII